MNAKWLYMKQLVKALETSTENGDNDPNDPNFISLFSYLQFHVLWKREEKNKMNVDPKTTQLLSN